MPKVKILLFTDSAENAYRYYSSELAGVITEWEEIADEELDWLSKHLKKLKAPYGLRYVLVVEDEFSTKYHIGNIRHFVEEEKAKQEAEEFKRKERARKTAETKRRNKEEKERKLLEQLSKKYAS